LLTCPIEEREGNRGRPDGDPKGEGGKKTGRKKRVFSAVLPKPSASM